MWNNCDKLFDYIQVNKVHLDLLDLEEKLDLQVHLDLLDLLEVLERLDLLDPVDNQVHLALLDHLDRLDLPDQEERLVPEVSRELQELQVCIVFILMGNYL